MIRLELVLRLVPDYVSSSVRMPEEAASLAAEVTAQVREHGDEALKVQASGVPAHLVELLDSDEHR